jgi:hypothetical protein
MANYLPVSPTAAGPGETAMTDDVAGSNDDDLDDIEIILKPSAPAPDPTPTPPPTTLADAPLPAAGAQPVDLPPPAVASSPTAAGFPIAVPPAAAGFPAGISPAPATVSGPPSSPTSSEGHPLWWVGVVSGTLVLLGIFLPYLSNFGVDVALIDADWQATATATVGALMVVGGLVGRTRTAGIALAGGAAVTWIGLFAVTLRPAVAAIQVADDLGDGGVDPGIGLILWGVAAVGAVLLIVIALGSVGGEAQPAWPFLVGAGGMALFWVGVILPIEGLELGDQFFFGDTWLDAAVVVLLAALPLGAVIAIVTRTCAGGLFALGVGGAWMASWAVYAIDPPTSGGLPVPFPDTPAAASLAVGLMSVTAVGALWWSAPAVSGGFGGAALAGGQVITIVICAGSGLAAVAGVANADDAGSFGGLVATSGTDIGSYEHEYEEEPPIDEGATDFVDEFSEDFSDDYESEFSEDFSSDVYDEPDDVTVTECVEVMCQPPAETWVVSLGSYFSEADALAAYQNLPASGVLFTNEYASLNPNIWMVYFDGGFVSGDEAVQYCFDVGRVTREQCFARRLSNDVGLDPNDPSLIVYPD